tara:strand:+ start:15602 stop:16462 length:861 start_codon:yes stop_codon:yes gene_type:complete
MSSPRIIYSLSAYPLVNNRWFQGNKLRETIYMTALSILYSHLWYDDIELYVDETAYSLLHMLPCRVTKIAVEKDKDLWMKSKIHAIGRQRQPFVHLDTDVFLTKKMEFDFERCLLERKEGGYQYHYKNQVAFFSKFASSLPHWNTNLGYSFSCGVIGFQDLALKDAFIQAYFEVEDIYIQQREAYQPLRAIGYEPCIVIEQYNLACLLAHHKVRPDLVLQGNNLSRQSKEAKKLGYNHLYGTTKYKEHIVQEVTQQLKSLFPYWYDAVTEALAETALHHSQKNVAS